MKLFLTSSNVSQFWKDSFFQQRLPRITVTYPKKIVLYYIAAENLKLGEHCELFQLNLSACLTVGLVLQPPFLMPNFSMRGDLQRTSERPIIVPRSLDDWWLHATRWQYDGYDGFRLTITFIPPPRLHHKWYFRPFYVVLWNIWSIAH